MGSVTRSFLRFVLTDCNEWSRVAWAESQGHLYSGVIYQLRIAALSEWAQLPVEAHEHKEGKPILSIIWGGLFSGIRGTMPRSLNNERVGITGTLLRHIEANRRTSDIR